jgi:glycerophosphoryl diester phosphodiesterase
MVLIIAHRGASGANPENTLAAFSSAISMKPGMVEFDVSLTKDKIPVVFHDTKMHRLTGHKGNLRNYTYPQLRTFDIGSWFDRKFSAERILTLEEALEVLKYQKINVEIKPDSYGSEIRILETVKSMKRRSDVIITSYDDRILESIRKHDRDIAIGAVAVFRWKKKLKKICRLNGICINPRISLLSERLVRQAHENNLSVFSWVVNERKSLQKAIKLKADGIFTDYPDRMRAMADVMR